MKNTLLAVILIILFSGCAQPQHVSDCVHGHTYGFWGGLWHGIIAPIAFVCSWFSDNVSVWAVNNNGGWYTFGFLLGIGAFGKFASDSSK